MSIDLIQILPEFPIRVGVKNKIKDFKGVNITAVSCIRKSNLAEASDMKTVF
jgi:hypothetical protein